MVDVLESMLQFLLEEMRRLRSRFAELDRDDRGSPSVETVLIASGLAVLALAVVAIIVAKVLSAAHNIPTH
jgi:hypothetical protein